MLQEQGLHRLMTVNAAPGNHRIHAEYTAQFADAQPQEQPFTGRFDGSFDKTNQPADLELDLSKAQFPGAPRPVLKFRHWEGPATEDSSLQLAGCAAPCSPWHCRSPS